MRVQLPNGIIDGQDHFNYVMVGELRGKQQNYLSDKDLVVGNIGHIPKIITDLVQSLETAEGLQWKGDKKELCWKLTVTDIEVILIKIREETFGPEFYHVASCSHCNYLHKNMKLNLSDLETTPISLQDLLDVTKRTVTLPKSGLEVELKPIYLRDLFEVIKISTKKTNSFITSIAALVTKRLGNKSPVTEVDIEDLPAKDVSFLGAQVEAMKAGNKEQTLILEGFIDTSIEYTCNSCKEDNKLTLNVFDPDFFDHSKATPT